MLYSYDSQSCTSLLAACGLSVVGSFGPLHISSVATVFVFNALYLLVQTVVHKSIWSTYLLFHS